MSLPPNNTAAWNSLIQERAHSATSRKEGGRLVIEELRLPRVEPPPQTFRVGGVVLKSACTFALYDTQVSGLHFRDCDLSGMRLFGVKIQDCVFEECDCNDLRVWSSALNGTEFRRCELEQLSLGGKNNAPGGGIVSMTDVRFAGTTISDGAAWDACFTRCEWRDGQIKDYMFRSCTFKDCAFATKFKNIEFDLNDAQEASNCLRCDFTGSTFNEVDFRRTGIIDVVWPNDRDHIVIKSGYGDALTRLVAALAQRPEKEAQGLAARFGHAAKWRHPLQDSGVIGLIPVRRDARRGGEELVRSILESISG